MLSVRCCSQPNSFKLPPRLARARRVAESKRMDTFREIHEALKKTAREEQAFIKELFTPKPDDDDENIL